MPTPETLLLPNSHAILFLLAQKCPFPATTHPLLKNFAMQNLANAFRKAFVTHWRCSRCSLRLLKDLVSFLQQSAPRNQDLEAIWQHLLGATARKSTEKCCKCLLSVSVSVLWKFVFLLFQQTTPCLKQRKMFLSESFLRCQACCNSTCPLCYNI